MQLDAATLARHTGRYDFAGTLVDIVVADGELVADGGTLGRYRLVPLSASKFYLADGVGEVTFSGDDAGHSARFTADLPNGRYTAPRVAER